MAFCMKCGAQLPDEAQFCLKCGSKMNAEFGAKMHEVVASRSEIKQSSDGESAEMSDVVAHKSRISQSAIGGGSGFMRNVSGDRSQFGQASVGSIHIGDQKRECPACGNPISSDNRVVPCSNCPTRFCETCESYFRDERKRAEKPLCEACFAENQRVEKVHQKKQYEAAIQAGEDWTSLSGIELIHIPAGTFTMGASELYNDEDYLDDEDWEKEKICPHQVKISSPFYIGKYQITQREWILVMESNPSRFIGDDRPVENVSWYDCQEFILKLNAKEGINKYRLPTEAEWEYACRAGSITRYYFGNDMDLFSNYAWFWDNSGKETHPVGKFIPNSWGLYDTLGNVYEWCSDWYEDYPAGSAIDPLGPNSGIYRIRRGGCWVDDPFVSTSSYRNYFKPSERDTGTGFRIVREL